MEKLLEETAQFPNFPKILNDIEELILSRNEKALEEYLNKLIIILPNNVSSLSFPILDSKSDELKNVTVERKIIGKKLEWGFKELCSYALSSADITEEN